MRPCYYSEDHYYCKYKDQCVSYKEDCDDGCPDDQLYCRETDSCHTPAQACYSECREKYKGTKLIQHAYCEATNSCSPYFTPCNGTCINYHAQKQPSQDGLSDPRTLDTVPCQGLDICYVEPTLSLINTLYEPACKATQVCKRHMLQCKDDEYVCDDQCVPLSATCNQSKCVVTNNKRGMECVRKSAGVFHNYRWCQASQACIPPDMPCEGKCKRSKPRMALCEAEGKCINIKNTCAGQCLLGRVRCPTEDRCVHKNGLHLCKEKLFQ